MFHAAWKSLTGHKTRLLMSALAIVLGVAFVAGSLVFTDMLKSAFNGIMNGSVADVNVQAKGQNEAYTSNTVLQRRITPATIDAIRGVDGVASAYGQVGAMDAYLFSKSGKVMATQGAPAVGSSWIDAPAFGGQQGLVVVEGRKPEAAGEIAIDPQSLAKGDYRIGDTIRFATSSNTAQPISSARIVGTALWGAKGSTAGATYAMFAPAYAQTLFLEGADAYQSVWVTAKPGVAVDDLAARVGRVVPADLEAVTGEATAKQLNDSIGTSLGFVSTFLLVFAGIALVVGSFLIVNTFSILVAQRSRELALLRALGASRAQVRRSVLFEAAVVGVVGSTLGLLAGLGLAKGIQAVFGAVGLDLTGTAIVVAPRTVVASYAVGVLVTMVAAYLPARRASSVPPVAAMTGDVLTGAADLGRRTLLGGTLLVLGLGALLLGLFVDVPQRLAWVGGGTLLTLFGVAGLSPIAGKPLIWLLGRLYVAAFGTVGRLAELNAVRNPRRTAATASALMIGLTLVTAMAVLGSSAKASIDSSLRAALRSDYVVMNTGQLPYSTAVGDRMSAVPGVAAVHRLRMQPATIDGKPELIVGSDADSFDRIVAQKLETGSLSAVGRNTLLVAKGVAAERGWDTGTVVRAELNGHPTDLTVAGTFSVSAGAGVGDLIVTLDTLAAAGFPATDTILAVERSAGADATVVRAGLDAVVADLPLVTVTDQAEYAALQAASVDQLLAVVYALLALAIVIAVLGIVNTLALSVIERTREMGLLRAVGLRRRQQAGMIVLESVVIAALGSVLGVTMGLAFGLALHRAMASQGLSQLAVPVGQLIGFLVVAGFVGVLAALWPAWRATRMGVLAAISTE